MIGVRSLVTSLFCDDDVATAVVEVVIAAALSDAIDSDEGDTGRERDAAAVLSLPVVGIRRAVGDDDAFKRVTRRSGSRA